MQAPAGPDSVSRLSLAGLMSQLYAISSKVWSRAVISIAHILGGYPSLQGDGAKLDRARARVLNREGSDEDLSSALAYSTQMQVASLRLDLENLEHIQRLVDEELSEPLSEPQPLPLSAQDCVLLERIRRGLWNLEGLRSAIEFVDDDLGELIERLIGPSSFPDSEMKTLRKSALVLRSLRIKIWALKAEIHRLETLNPRPLDPSLRAPRERRVRFQLED